MSLNKGNIGIDYFPDGTFSGREYECPLCSDSGKMEMRKFTEDTEFKVGIETIRKNSQFHSNHWDWLFDQISVSDFLNSLPVEKDSGGSGFIVQTNKISDYQLNLFNRIKTDGNNYISTLNENLFIGEKRAHEKEFLFKNSKRWIEYSSKYERSLKLCNCRRGIALQLTTTPKLEDKTK